MNIKKLLANYYMLIARGIRGMDKSVTFISFSGKSYSDNPKAISEKLHEIAPEIKINWLIKSDSAQKDVPDYVHCFDVNNRWGRMALMARTKCLVSNFSFPMMPKSKKQMFIQTWHGDKAFKKVLHDSNFVEGDFSVSEEIPGYCNLAIAGSKYGKQQYRSAFKYAGKILMEGTPRNDRLVHIDEKHQAQIKEALNLLPNAKLLLYAPTLRRENYKNRTSQSIKELNVVRTINTLEKRDNCKWICLLRAHPTMVGLIGAGDDSRIIDVSDYSDMADLLEISDMLITDYSSCAGDFLLTGRPVILFQADLEDYLKKERTLYFDINESPYWSVNSQVALEEKINSITPEMAEKNCKDILAFYGDCETGHASLSVAKIIKEWIEK